MLEKLFINRGATSAIREIHENIRTLFLILDFDLSDDEEITKNLVAIQ
jgi:hypothetical protein